MSILPPPPAPETPAGGIADEILASAAALRAASPDAQPMAFWDFDGTLFQGDCSEGFKTGMGGPRVAGLAEAAVLAGWSRRYPAAAGMQGFWLDYRNLMRREGHAAAYLHLAQAFAGAPETKLLALAGEEFRSHLQPWFFREALALWHLLEAGGVRCEVISASPDFFVKGASSVLGVPPERLHGLRLLNTDEGLLTSWPMEPLTIGAGKAAVLREILSETAGGQPGERFAVAGFGNDLVTDGPMLEAVASATLPAGTPFAALVNCRKRDAGTSGFRLLSFHARSRF